MNYSVLKDIFLNHTLITVIFTLFSVCYLLSVICYLFVSCQLCAVFFSPVLAV